jgi:hypothetical protein
MSTRIFLTLAALVAAAGILPAQQFQVQVKPAMPAGASGPATKPGSTEFKPDAKADPDPKSLDVPADVQQKVNDLVRKLGSPVYREREKASRDLVAFGRLALPALAEAAKSSDEPEVVERAEALMPKAQALDMKARVGCFLADTEGKYEHTLPGWGRFKDTAGNTKASRELFAEALKNKTTHQMLLAAEQNPEDAGTVLSAYISKMQGYYNRWGGGYEQPTPPKTADLAIALFLEGQYSDRQVVVNMPFQWGGGGQYYSVANHITSSSDFSAALSNRAGKFTDPLRKIIQKWMDTRETANGCNQAYSFAQQMFGRKPALKYAARVLGAEGLPNTQYIKTNILQQFGSEGAKEYLADIVKCFDDSSVYSGTNSSDGQYHEMQLRDYALYVAVQMTDQSPKDYGFTPTGSGNSTSKVWHQSAFYFKDDRDAAERGNGPGVRIIRNRAAQPPPEEKKPEEKKPDDKAKKLSADDKRKVAFKKWEEWQAANMKDGKLIEQPKKADESKKDEGKKDAPKAGGDAEAVARDAAAKAEQLKAEAIKKEAAAKAAEDAKKKEEKK